MKMARNSRYAHMSADQPRVILSTQYNQAPRQPRQLTMMDGSK
jgi:hypothetical protein